MKLDVPMGEIRKVTVLDRGYVRLVDHMGDDLSIVRAARVSYDADWRAGEDDGSDTKLIRYLLRNKHTSPFEAVEFQFEIKCPIFVVRQWHRHRTWSYNEVSARYTELPEEFYVPSPQVVGFQSPSSKQARVIGVDQLSVDELNAKIAEIDTYKSVCRNAFEAYAYMMNRGWPRELARAVLPVSTYTRFFAKVDLKNLLDFIRLRDHEHAQWEIRQYAKAIRELIEPIVPVTLKAWGEINAH